jgi:gliding motility-associated lipoprotein GldH
MMRLLFGFFLIVGISSCEGNAILNDFISINNGEWKYDQLVENEVEIQDTSKVFQLSVNVRHEVDYEWANLFCLLHIQHPDGKKFEQRINLVLAEPDGKWKGKGIGSIKEARIPVALVKFPKKGTYTFQLEQNMRLNPLKGIENIGCYLAPEELIPDSAIVE